MEHETKDVTIFVVCLDELTRTILKKLDLKNVVLIPLHEIERGDEELLAAKRNRALVEYYWTLTPTVILRIIERYPHIDLLTYSDADLFFFSAPDPIFDELGDDSVLIHEHRFSPGLEQLAEHGIYNVGLLCFKNDVRGLEVLRWWRAKCNEWCYARVEDGKFGDQLYLNDWTERFQGIHVLKHIGAGVAPWNQIQYRFATDPSGSVSVDGMPVVFYHFHAFDFFSPDVIVLAKHGYTLTNDVVHYCYFPYILNISKMVDLILRLSPDFNFGLYVNGILSDNHAYVIKKQYIHVVNSLGISGDNFELDNMWTCYCASQIPCNTANPNV